MPSARDLPFDDFEAFYEHFLTSHRSSGTRWAHVGAAAVGLWGAGRALRRRRLRPLLLGTAGFAALAVLSHPLFEGNWPENFGRPLWAARAFARLCLQTLTGTVPAPRPAEPAPPRAQP